MTVTLSTIDRPVAIRQAMSAGNDFSGVSPANGGGPVTPTFADDIFKFDALLDGGLFDPTSVLYSFESRESLMLVGVELDMATAASWSIYLVDVDGNELLLWTGTEAAFVVTEDTRVLLPWGSKLKLTSSGASGAIVATLRFVPAKLLYHELRRNL